MGNPTTKKALIIDPYLDTLGGGERYMLTVASFLVKWGWSVEVLGFDASWRKKATDKFGLSLEKVSFRPGSLPVLPARISFLKKYDLCFYPSDGSIPWLFAHKNLLHFQVPFIKVNQSVWLNKLKLSRTTVVCNSKFTKRFIDQEFGIESEVLYPPVAVTKFKPGEKEKVILYAGRFTDLLHHKRQDVLIEAFRQLSALSIAAGWRLVLAGSDGEGKDLVKRLKKMSENLPVDIKTNLTFNQLKKEYARASLFWVAAGFGVVESQNPEAVEHFGITTVEAMAAGCVPVVIAKGGQTEIVTPGENGFTWSRPEELVELTRVLLQNPAKIQVLAKEAIKSSCRYSEKKFGEKLKETIGGD